MNRRKFLKLAGGGVILAAGSTFGWVATRSPDKALEPWSTAGANYEEPRRRALSFAILAPNPHNRQPWLVDLSQPEQVILTVDTEKMLPHTDPFNRQITIGLGCFLEVMRMAAAEDGYRVDVSLFPEGHDNAHLDDRPVAVASFLKDAGVSADPLFAHVHERRSLKEPFDTLKPVEDAVLSKLRSSITSSTEIGSTNDLAKVEELRALTHQALAIEIDTPRTYKESVDLFRIGKNEVDANPDGIDFSGPFFETLGFVGAMTREAALDVSSSIFTEGRKAVLENTETAMAHVWLTTKGNSRIDQIGAGTDWVRLNLAATAQGVGIQPLSQILQEYEEMQNLYAKAHKLLAPGGGTVQMLARLGYAAPVPPSPRWPLEAKIIKG